MEWEDDASRKKHSKKFDYFFVWIELVISFLFASLHFSLSKRHFQTISLNRLLWFIALNVMRQIVSFAHSILVDPFLALTLFCSRCCCSVIFNYLLIFHLSHCDWLLLPLCVLLMEFTKWKNKSQNGKAKRKKKNKQKIWFSFSCVFYRQNRNYISVFFFRLLLLPFHSQRYWLDCKQQGAKI